MEEKKTETNHKKLLTVFTSTYNRAHTLHLGYEALLRQTCKDFVWLIVDDGSTDHSKLNIVIKKMEGYIQDTILL